MAATYSTFEAAINQADYRAGLTGIRQKVQFNPKSGRWKVADVRPTQYVVRDRAQYKD